MFDIVIFLLFVVFDVFMWIVMLKLLLLIMWMFVFIGVCCGYLVEVRGLSDERKIYLDCFGWKGVGRLGMMCLRVICVFFVVVVSFVFFLVVVFENLGFCFFFLLLLLFLLLLCFCLDDEEFSYLFRVLFCWFIVIVLWDGKWSINVVECVFDGEFDGVVFFYVWFGMIWWGLLLVENCCCD